MRCTEDEKAEEELKQVGDEWGGMGAMEWRYFASPWSRGHRDTDVREQKFPWEKREKSAHFSARHCGAQSARARVSNWLRVLTSSHTFCPGSPDICCENYDPGCADGTRVKGCHAFVFASIWTLLLLFWVAQIFHCALATTVPRLFSRAVWILARVDKVHLNSFAQKIKRYKYNECARRRKGGLSLHRIDNIIKDYWEKWSQCSKADLSRLEKLITAWVVGTRLEPLENVAERRTLNKMHNR